LAKDITARIGVRRDPKNPDRKQKVFGYNAVFSTSLELYLGIELPVAVNNIAGNVEEADFFIKNSHQDHSHHKCKVKIDSADAKYDALKNYQCIRAKGSIPIIDYNVKNKSLSKKVILQRGYDQNGWPFAPCKLLCRPNGFDEKRRLTFCFFKQCLTLKYKALENLKGRFNIATCPHLQN